ncbi:MAG TPA: phospho-sugar mutase, partial [Streptosporangiaceae bacterium]|nr:phospho-sugar mutase [Streptosporangiaceae bacterium]
PPTEGLRLRLAPRRPAASSDTRVVIRPSGTEPKLKCYLETVIPVQGEVAETRAQAASDLATLKSALAELLALA